jgi:hypothetical protein
MKLLYTGATEIQVIHGKDGTDDPREFLEVGRSYNVKSKEIRAQYVVVRLADFPDRIFNSVCFEDTRDYVLMRKDWSAVLSGEKGWVVYPSFPAAFKAALNFSGMPIPLDEAKTIFAANQKRKKDQEYAKRAADNNGHH